MSQDDVAQALQLCSALVKEVQRRADGAASRVNQELIQNLKLARQALLRATKKEVAIPPIRTATAAGGSGGSGSGQPPTLTSTQTLGTRCPATTTTTTAAATAVLADRRAEVFQSGPLWSVILCAFYWNKRKLCEQALTALQQMLRCRQVDLDLYTTLFLSPYVARGSSSSASSAPLPAAGGVAALLGAARLPSATSTSGASMNANAPAAAAAAAAAAANDRSSGGNAKRMKALCRVGEGVLVALSEYLGTASEPAVQTRIYHTLQGLIGGRGQSFFVGKCVTRTVHAAFTVALQASQEAMRHRSHHFIQLCVTRVTCGFVIGSSSSSSAAAATADGGGVGSFASSTLLDDYTVDVAYDAPFTRVTVTDDVPDNNTNSPAAATPLATFGGSGTNTSGNNEGTDNDGWTNSSGRAHGESLSPASFFAHSSDDVVVKDAMAVLVGREGRLPQLLKDMLLLLRSTCRLASRPISGSPTEGNAEVRARQLALRMLQRLFTELPVANGAAEHRCGPWLALVLAACKFDLLRVLVRNLGCIAPFSFFESAMSILAQVLRKCHYPVARELHTLLAVYLLPMASSPYCDFRQKHAVLAMIHELFSVPHLLISYFINYDCSPTFDAGGLYGGMLELLVDFVVDLTYADIVGSGGNGEEEDWLNSDQQQLLRGECVVALHALVKSLHRWVAEDPREYARARRESTRQAVAGHVAAAADAALNSRGTGGGANSNANISVRRGSDRLATAHAHEWAEAYLDNWTSDDDEGDERGATATATNGTNSSANDDNCNDSSSGATAALLGRDVSFVSDGRTGLTIPQWGRDGAVRYHWKHIHYLMHNKRIALDAVGLINVGKWKEARPFLESRGYIPVRAPSEAEVTAVTATKDVSPVDPGTSSFAELARFLSEYPGVSRDAISGIFDRINRDPEARLLLREYLHLFNYQGVPIDVAMRDTTCKFMSWDRPMFEAQVWETIQGCFGDEYARQNRGVVTPKDADTMAGVLLFLHSNLHNEIAASSRFKLDQFVVDANACLDIPMEEDELRAMFVRVQRRKWELDAYGRTPAEAERASTAPSVAFKIMTEKLISEQSRRARDYAAGVKGGGAGAGRHHVDPMASGGSPLTATVGGHRDNTNTTTATATAKGAATTTGGAAGGGRSRRHGAPSSPMGASTSAASSALAGRIDIALLDPGAPSYCDDHDTLKLREDHHLAFTHAARLSAAKLEAVHRCYCGDRESYHPQPYAAPHYGEHVRPLLLFTYPSAMSCVYMGYRVLEAAPLARQLADISQTLFDIAAAVVVNLGDMHSAVSETILRCLEDERAYRLVPPTRATFVPFLLDAI